MYTIKPGLKHYHDGEFRREGYLFEPTPDELLYFGDKFVEVVAESSATTLKVADVEQPLPPTTVDSKVLADAIAKHFGIRADFAMELVQVGIDTPDKVESARDEELRLYIGKATLATIRGAK